MTARLARTHTHTRGGSAELGLELSSEQVPMGDRAGLWGLICTIAVEPLVPDRVRGTTQPGVCISVPVNHHLRHSSPECPGEAAPRPGPLGCRGSRSSRVSSPAVLEEEPEHPTHRGDLPPGKEPSVQPPAFPYESPKHPAHVAHANQAQRGEVCP